MKKIALSTLLSGSLYLVSSSALAQGCPPGSWLCADVSISTGFQTPVQPVVQPVVVQPQPVVVVQPQPTYVIQQPQPTYVIQQPQPTYVVQQQAPQYVVTNTYQWGWMNGRSRTFGVGAFGSGMLLSGRGSDGDGHRSAGMGGAGLSLRVRTHPWLATEATLGFYGGRDYNGDTRGEVPVTLNELVYFNPQHRLQFYGLFGVGASFAGVTRNGTSAPSAIGRDPSVGYAYVGGQLGLGLEWQVSPNFSLYTDLRGFLRTRVDGNTNTPEFTRVQDGRVETTNTSIGSTAQFGAMFYF
ncbi:MAG: hypothetical protein HY909_29750 [Deltaproteobacteria bacterium]|nr:hypothetical protein [Deltaproteobacteria bacterium]